MKLREYMDLNYACGQEFKLSGYLVIVDDKVALIDESEIENFKNAVRVYIDQQDIKYVLKDILLPLGGESSIFHKATVTGVVRSSKNSIEAQKIQVQERGGLGWLDVDLSENYIQECKDRYQENDGFDFFKEMGD